MDSIASSQHPGKWFGSDEAFHSLYPLSIQHLAYKHWTPLRVARTAAGFLAPRKGVRILDIGSGIGKFCLAAAHYKPGAHFTGIEQRIQLVMLANDAKSKLKLSNVSFIHNNFTRINFREYDHFYFFNSFYENLSGTSKIDDSIEYSSELYNYYCRCLHKKLDDMPKGTRLVTFHSLEDEVPFSYQPVLTRFNNRLKCWIKE